MNIENMYNIYNPNKFGANLLIFHTNYKKFINVELSRFGLNLIQALCLVIINRQGNLNQKELADNLFLTKGAITKAINKLESEGLVFREKSEEDRRNYVLNTTEKGKELVPDIIEINMKWESEMGLKELPYEFEEIFKQLALKSIELNMKFE